ncbi:Lrp/AsnC family transcriptional regulator [Croceicoccus sediminis]|uniref:Lrp/AsnC family transcriptional regulator n=1 Tax=Croceicoccus sediminis TaxID=2571150 RepID=UPI0011838DA2|nr:Lrp/AsnC ligand binding domain-containing protein [Croceicoccus sediminis]
MPKYPESQGPIDRLDRRIIEELQTDGRLTVTELARRVGLSKTPCQLRMKRLMDEGYIRGFRAVVDPVKLGLAQIAFAEVKLLDTGDKSMREFRKAVLQVEQVEECHMIAGNFDFLLKVRTKDIASYRQVLGERISTLPNVSSTSSFVVMETIVEAGD